MIRRGYSDLGLGFLYYDGGLCDNRTKEEHEKSDLMRWRTALAYDEKLNTLDSFVCLYMKSLISKRLK